MVLPTFALLQAAMLANILPRLLWPDNERIRMAGLIVGLAVPAVVLIAHIRRRRQRKSP
jgi:hypothetical protein